jgi:putative oxidoreductase
MSSISRKLPTIARVILGVVFFVFGLNGFFHFLPQPPAPERAMAFAGALAATGYFFPLLKATEVFAGALLLTGALVPFALTLLAPIIVNIVAFHAFLAPGNYAVVGLVLATEIYLAYVNRAAFAPLFARRGARTTEATAARIEAAVRSAA